MRPRPFDSLSAPGATFLSRRYEVDSMRFAILFAVFSVLLIAPSTIAAEIEVDLTAWNADSGIDVELSAEELVLRWPIDGALHGKLALALDSDRPLFAALGYERDGRAMNLLRNVEPVILLTVGERRTPSGKPADQKWRVFFDKPASRLHSTHRAELRARHLRAASRGRRTSVSLDGLRAGAFHGELVVTLYPGAPLVHIDAVVRTDEDTRAIIYDAGLVSASPEGVEDAGGSTPLPLELAWRTPGFAPQPIERAKVDAETPSQIIRLAHRTIAVERDGGTVACFPPPHQFQFPRDWTNNFGNGWYGRDHLVEGTPLGFGIHQDPSGGGAFVPWFNAPPGVDHHLGFFLAVSAGDAKAALDDVLRFTRGDRFAELPGHITFTSHWHMAVAVTAMAEREKGNDPPPVPSFKRMFEDLGVNAVHLADFHGDGHQKDPGPLRLPELDSLFSECRRLSDRSLLLIPGEEVNTFLGVEEEGKHPGHWMSLFPRPVYWTMVRGPDEPFTTEDPKRGRIYHVGSREDMMRLLHEEHGLAWTAHPRIKASSWTPDIFRHEDFYLDDTWLGGAWKAMPGDLSKAKLGEETLDLLSDMANWGGDEKYLIGEVDVFKLDPTHELFGHMNINYLRLDELPRFEDGFAPILDALRNGRFFVTTGEILIPEFTVGDRQSGEHLASGEGLDEAELAAALDWTFPLAFAEIVAGDGERVYRERIDLGETQAFGKEELRRKVDLRGRRWVRFEVWDVASNGAFTEPVWIEE